MGLFSRKALSLGGKLTLKNVNFQYEIIFLGDFTLGGVHSINLPQIWYGNSWYMWRCD